MVVFGRGGNPEFKARCTLLNGAVEIYAKQF